MLKTEIRILTLIYSLLIFVSSAEARWKNYDRATVKVSCGSYRPSIELKIKFFEDEKLSGEPYAVLSNEKFVKKGDTCEKGSCWLSFDSDIYFLQIVASESPRVLAIPFDKQIDERTYMAIHKDKKLFFNIENKECIFLNEKESAEFVQNPRFPYKSVAPTDEKTKEPFSSAFVFWIEKPAKDVFKQFMRDYPQALAIVNSLKSEIKIGSFEKFNKKLNEYHSKGIYTGGFEDQLRAALFIEDDYAEISASDQAKAFNKELFQKGLIESLSGKLVLATPKFNNIDNIVFCDQNLSIPICTTFEVIKKKENGQNKTDIKFGFMKWYDH